MSKTETIEEKTYRLLQIANKNDEGVAIDSDFEGEMFNSLLDNTIFKLHCKMIELAIAEEHAACVNAPARTLMQTANMLPHGWTMQIDLQKGSGGVTLFGPFDDLYELDTGNGIEADMAQAVQFANFRNAEQGTAVNGAWSRFVAAMGNDMPAAPKTR